MTTENDQTTSTSKQYPCPNCSTLTTWQLNQHKPFCSERCKLIDLGAWANEDYKIASVEDELFSSTMNLDH